MKFSEEELIALAHFIAAIRPDFPNISYLLEKALCAIIIELPDDEIEYLLDLTTDKTYQ